MSPFYATTISSFYNGFTRQPPHTNALAQRPRLTSNTQNNISRVNQQPFSPLSIIKIMTCYHEVQIRRCENTRGRFATNRGNLCFAARDFLIG